MTCVREPAQSQPRAYGPRPHPRTIGWIGTGALALGGSNQSLFLIGALFAGQGNIAGQGSAAVPLLVLGLLLSWAAVPGWTELILLWPNRVGGIAAACSQAFRPYSPVLSALAGACYILSASAIHQWYLPSVPINAIAIAIICAFVAVNLCGIRSVVNVAIPIAAVSAGLAFLSALVPVLSGRVDWHQATTFHLTTPFSGWFGSLTSLMAGLYLIGFAAPAFEAAACHVGETIDPSRNVPRAMFGSAAMSGLYFIALPVVWLGVLGPEPLGRAVWLLRRDAPELERPYRAPRGTVGLGICAAVVWGVSAVLGFEQFGLPTVILGLVFAYAGAGLYAWRKLEGRRRLGLSGIPRSLHLKLTGAMLFVLLFDGAGYCIAVSSISEKHAALIATLQDIFVAVAMLTVTVGLVLPGMIAHAALEVSRAARQLVSGTVEDFTRAMEALGRGDLDAAHADVEFFPVAVRSHDELGEMGTSFNALQTAIARAALGLAGAREGLRAARLELVGANANLRERIAERTQLVGELIAAKDAAEAASVAKGQFLAKMSHEIRTPMNGVLSTAELLLVSELTDRQRRLAAIIHRSGGDLLAIIDQILDLSKLEAGKFELERIDFNLREAIEQTLDLFAERAAKKGLKLRALLPPSARSRVVGDPTRMRQVLSNLLSNAIKFTERGEVSVELTVREETAEAVGLEIAVRDTGVGISPAFKSRLFDSFSQADSATTRKYGGTGLGLAIAKQIVEAAGGQILVESEPGEGATFRVRLTLAKAESAETSEDARLGDLGQAYRTPTAVCSGSASSHRILLVEDNVVNREVIAESAAYLGYDLDIVDNGAAAVAAHRTAPYDLILMDCHMPVLDGYEATEAIRRLEGDNATSLTPIIALSANAMKGDDESCLACGMDDYLAKPFRLEGLRSVLERWLKPGCASPRGAAEPADRAERHAPAEPRRDDAARLPIVDETALERIGSLQRPGRPNVLEKIVRSFSQSTPQLFDALEKAVAEQSFTEVREYAHGLKSSSANLGAMRLSRRFRELEGIADERDCARARMALREIRDAYAPVQDCLATYVSEARYVARAGGAMVAGHG